MLRPRIIPCLLIQNDALVKTVKFKDPKYIGDPINAVKIFNEKEADELIILDIGATQHSTKPNFNLIEKLAIECRMPLCYGGGITSVNQVIKLVDMGVEKVAISAAAIRRPSLIKELISAVGNQSIVVVLDVYKNKNFFSEKGFSASADIILKLYKFKSGILNKVNFTQIHNFKICYYLKFLRAYFLKKKWHIEKKFENHIFFFLSNIFGIRNATYYKFCGRERRVINFPT